MSLLPQSDGRPSSRRRKDPEEHATFAYMAGLMGVGLAMVLLPASYLIMTGGLLWLLGGHLVGNLSWVMGPQGGLPSTLAYLLLGLFLTTLTSFLLRPFVLVKRRSRAEMALTPMQEPRLHAFILQICTVLGAPAPTRIQVSMDVNASARLAPGWRNYWDGSLELILGLPLVRGLELGQFAGVLAHELGHFRQDRAMRLVHAIRTVNQWFSRAAAREDDWEREFAESRHRMDPFLYGLCWSARICTWMARHILQAHVRAGQAVSCVLLRQMEHQADGAAIRLVGGETFSSMVLEAKVIESAWGLANRSLGMSLREGRLADDLPALVAAHTRVFIPEVRRKMERTLLAESTAFFDTHPSLADRVRHARRACIRGVFHSNDPSHALFSDFASLSRNVTASFYRRDLGEDFNPSRMMSTSDLVTGQSDVQVGEAAVSGYFLGLLTNLRPLWLSVSDLEGPDPIPLDPAHSRKPLEAAASEKLRNRLKAARARIEKDYLKASELSRSYSVADARMLDAVQALALMRANFWIQPGDFQLRKGGALQAATAFQESEAEKRGISSKMHGYEAAMRIRLGSALCLLDDPSVREHLPDSGSCSYEASRLMPILAALGKIQPRLESLRRSFHGLGVLLENLDGNESAPAVGSQLKIHALAIRMDLEEVVTGFAGLEYPFRSGCGPAGLAGYVLEALPAEWDFVSHHAAAEEALGRCYALYFRIFGRLALTAGRVEGVLGLGPLQVDG